MSCFRNLNKVVSSQLFAKPNQLVLLPCVRPVYLVSADEPNVDYLHSAKALLSTIQQLQALSGASGFSKLINQELNVLKAS